MLTLGKGIVWFSPQAVVHEKVPLPPAESFPPQLQDNVYHPGGTEAKQEAHGLRVHQKGPEVVIIFRSSGRVGHCAAISPGAPCTKIQKMWMFTTLQNTSTHVSFEHPDHCGIDRVSERQAPHSKCLHIHMHMYRN